jgi:hypothetical protein
MQTRSSSGTLQLTLILLFVLLFVFFSYTFLHEGGHAIIGFVFGQSLTEFNVNFWDLSAHVGMAGGELTQSQLAIQAVAGVSLPLLIWAIFIGFVPRKASFILETLKLVSSLTVLNTLLAWTVIPILYIFGRAPSSDDVTHFLRYSPISPLLLMFIVLILYLCGWAYFLSKIDGLWNEFLLFRITDRATLTAGVRTIIPVLISILTFGAISVFLLNRSAVKNPLDKLAPPPGFVVVAEIDFSMQVYSAETLAEFTVDEPAYVGVFIAVRGINTSYFDLRVVGPGGYNSVVMHGEGYRADRDGGLWEESLSPGTYQLVLVLTSHQSPGTASVFLKTP